MSNRRISVYDVTALRVHPDGRRVDPAANKPRSRYWAPGATQDDQGNWIAVDAAGSFHVPRYTKRRKITHNGEASLEGMDDGESDDGYREEMRGKESMKSTKGKEKPRESVTKDRGPEKRRKFKKDESFLGTGLSRSTNIAPEMPSQELLKAIHHFTANHYVENGFLHNSSKEYRIRRKKRREGRLRAQGRATTGVIEGDASRVSDAEAQCNSGANSDLDQEDNGDAESVGDSDGLNAPALGLPEPGSSTIKGPGRPKRSKQYRDMYRVFDGSALMAIGILCQEYVRHLVKAPTPHQRLREGSMSTHERETEGNSNSTSNSTENTLPYADGSSELSQATTKKPA